MSAAADFIDGALRFEGSWERAEAHRERVGADLRFYGASVGAVRGTVRDALRRHPVSTRDDAVLLAVELWTSPVFERRLAAVVLMQTRVDLLRGTDLTRLEGFLRDARTRELADPIAVDVVTPLVRLLTGAERIRADAVISRWAAETSPWLRSASAAVLAEPE